MAQMLRRRPAGSGSRRLRGGGGRAAPSYPAARTRVGGPPRPKRRPRPPGSRVARTTGALTQIARPATPEGHSVATAGSAPAGDGAVGRAEAGWRSRVGAPGGRAGRQAGARWLAPGPGSLPRARAARARALAGPLTAFLPPPATGAKLKEGPASSGRSAQGAGPRGCHSDSFVLARPSPAGRLEARPWPAGRREGPGLAPGAFPSRCPRGRCR